MPDPFVEKHTVEFWPKPVANVQDNETPQVTECVDENAALALQSTFHKIGWPARSVTLRVSTQRIYVG